MQVLKDKLGRLFTEKEYFPESDGSELEPVNWSDNSRYKVDHEDFVVTVPGHLSLGQLDEDLAEWNMVSTLWAPKHYSISRILAEDWGHENQRQVLGLELKHYDSSETKTGGKVIKNVSGYDLSKIYLGSFNSFAIIKTAYLRLEKLPSMQNDIELKFNFKDPKEFFNIKLMSFLYHLASSNFDKSIKMLVILERETIGYNFKLKINLSAEEDLLMLRSKKIARKLNDYFSRYSGFKLEESFKYTKTEFKKSYASKDTRIEFHSKLDNLANLYLKLNECFGDRLVMYPKQARIDLISSPMELEAMLKQFQEMQAVSHLGPYFINIYPINHRNRNLERNYNEASNKAEDRIIKDLKRNYDPKNLLNPGILL